MSCKRQRLKNGTIVLCSTSISTLSNPCHGIYLTAVPLSGILIDALLQVIDYSLSIHRIKMHIQLRVSNRNPGILKSKPDVFTEFRPKRSLLPWIIDTHIHSEINR